MGENKGVKVQQMVQGDKRGGDTGVSKERVGESGWGRIARFRLGNEMREGRYWEAVMPI